MPTRMFNDGGEYTYDDVESTVIHQHADCGHISSVAVLMTICKVSFRLSHDEVDALIKTLAEAKETMLDQIADIEESAESDQEHDDDE